MYAKVPHDAYPGLRRIKQIHFTGIAGSGMNGIAEVLLNQGYAISGSDLQDNAVTQRLTALGARIVKGHQAENIVGADVVVQSSAIKEDNIEIVAARKARIPVVARAQMLAELMRFRFGIAVAGTHGKTTTTSLIACILAEAGFDPTFVIGGLLNSAGSNARLGASHYLVAEADESDASFLYLQPMMAVVTNIDRDHMLMYEDDFLRLRNTFLNFIHHLPFYGLAVLCNEDPGVNDILSSLARPYLTYGFNDAADIQAIACEQKNIITYFQVKRARHNDLHIQLNMPGRHNILNALAAIAIATELEISDEAICTALRNFSGIGRRFHIRGEVRINGADATLIDDYGHHPREIAATVEAVRAAWPDRRLVMIFQPHRYSRTQALFDDFSKELAKVDELLMLDIYSAGEEAIPGISSQALCQNIQQHSVLNPHFIERQDDIDTTLKNILQPNDILLTQGAGSIASISINLYKQFQK